MFIRFIAIHPSDTFTLNKSTSPAFETGEVSLFLFHKFHIYPYAGLISDRYYPKHRITNIYRIISLITQATGARSAAVRWPVQVSPCRSAGVSAAG